MELKNSIHLTNFPEYMVFQNEMTLLYQSTSKAEKRPVNILCGLIMSTFTLKHKHLCYTRYVVRASVCINFQVTINFL